VNSPVHRFHGKRRPWEMGAEAVGVLTHLAAERDVAASSQRQAHSAIPFLYQQVLEHDPGWIEGVKRAKKPLRPPVVPNLEEARMVLATVPKAYRLMAELLHGGGLQQLAGGCSSQRIRRRDGLRGIIRLSQSNVTVFNATPAN
jgi:hypothetical protein